MDNKGQLLTVGEVAKYLRISPESVRRWLRAAKLPGINLGRGSGWRIRGSDLEHLLRERGFPPTGNRHPRSESGSTGAGDGAADGATQVEVTCVSRQPLQNPHTGITHLGGGARRWETDEVIQAIRAGTHNFYTLSDGIRADVCVYDGPFSSYLRTRVAERWQDSLLVLAECPDGGG